VCVELTNLPPSCANCLEILQHHRPGTLKACPGLYRYSFTFFYIQCRQAKSRKDGCDFSILRLFEVLNTHQYLGIWTHTKVIKGSYLPNCVMECDESVTRRNCWKTARKNYVCLHLECDGLARTENEFFSSTSIIVRVICFDVFTVSCFKVVSFGTRRMVNF